MEFSKLLTKALELKEMLVAYATGKGGDEAAYSKLRSELIMVAEHYCPVL